MLINSFYKVILICLIATIIIEIITAFICKVRDKKDFINIILVNIITNPIVVVIPYIIYLYYGVTYRYISLFILEVLTVITEGYIFHRVLKYNKINAYVFSMILNVSSYLIGELLGKIIW